MADDLGAEWWLDKNGAASNEADDTQDVLDSKRPIEAVLEEDGLKRKKKRKRRKITDKLTKKEDVAATVSDFQAWLGKFGIGELCAVELEDLEIKEGSFLEANSEKLPLSKYLSQTVSDWRSRVESGEPPETKSCLLLLVTSSAKRAVDLNREANDFKGKCYSGKLFAKHMKLKEQISLLTKKKLHFAVGTPNRISALITAGALNISKTSFLILDWNWRDIKQRRLIDMPELEKDLFHFLKKSVVPALPKSNIKLGLY